MKLCVKQLNVSLRRGLLFSLLLLGLLPVQAVAASQPLLLKDISTAWTSNVTNITVIGNLAYFSAYDPEHAQELWVTDGTEAGTRLVMDIDPGPGASNPDFLTNVDGTLFFMASDPENGKELWKSDGTAEGTVLVKDILPGAAGSFPAFLVNINGTLLFRATDPVHGMELWKSDGTAEGTVLVKDINSGAADSDARLLINLGGTVFFQAIDADHGLELWKSDGSEAGTLLVKDIEPGPVGSNPFAFVDFDGVLFFHAHDAVNRNQLWKSDGTMTGTVLVSPSLNSNGYPMVNIGGTLFVGAEDLTNGFELWKSDGTEPGTFLVKDIYPGVGRGLIGYATNVNGTLFFAGDDPTNGKELWRSDGTEPGTVLVKDIFPGSGNSDAWLAVNINGTLFFVATDPISGRELWKSDGTEAGTVLVTDLFPGVDSSSPEEMRVFRNNLLFRATDMLAGHEPFILDLTSPTVQVTVPANASTFVVAAGITISGTASDDMVGLSGVEVSTDGGNSWATATDTSVGGDWTSWEYLWAAPVVSGSYPLLARSIDRATNVSAASGPTITLETHSNNDFNSGTLPAGWNLPGDSPWTFDSSVYHSPGFSMRSGVIGDNGWTAVEIPSKTVGSGEVSFWFRTDSQSGDALRFFIDGNQVGVWDGSNDWTQVSFPVSAGTHSFGWSYQKDASGSSGADAVWIDDVVFPAVAGGGNWTVNRFDFYRQAIDWPASQHGTVPSGSFLNIGGTYYKVLNSWVGNAYGSNDASYIGAEITPCDQQTGLQNSIDVWGDVFTGKPITWSATLGAPPIFCPVSLYEYPNSSALLMAPGQNQSGGRVWSEDHPADDPALVTVMTLVGETPTLLDSWTPIQFMGFGASPSINSAGDVVWDREDAPGILMIHGIVNGSPITPFPGFSPAINDFDEIVYVDGSALMSSTRGLLATISGSAPLRPDINNHGDVVWAQGSTSWTGTGFSETWSINRLDNAEGATITTVASRSTVDAPGRMQLYFPTISDAGEVVWMDSGTLYSSLRGPLAFNCLTALEARDPDFIGNDSLIFIGHDRSVNPRKQAIYRLDLPPLGCPGDLDCDGMPDSWENANGLNPADPTDATLDADSDGLGNLAEFQAGTNPQNPDSDGDGLNDGVDPNPTVFDPSSATMLIPANEAVLTGASETFTWTDAGASLYQIHIGSTPGGSDLGMFPAAGTTATTTTVDTLPVDGRTLYVRLWSLFGATWSFNDYTYTAAGSPAAAMVTPGNGSLLSGATQDFTWSDAGASLYQIHIGTTFGGSDLGMYPAAGTTATATTVSGLPVDGRTLYVRLWSLFGADWTFNDYTYTAAGSPAAAMVTPAGGSLLAGASQPFTWSNAGADLYMLYVSTMPGGDYDLGRYEIAGTTTSTVVSGLPLDGRTVYVRLWSQVGGSWSFNDYSYTAASGPTAAMLTPSNGTTLSGASQIFVWSAAVADLYQLHVGTTPGGSELGMYPAAGTIATSTLVSGLPLDGRTLYVRLWSQSGASWSFNDYIYTAAAGSPAAAMLTPSNGTILSGASQEFIWSDAVATYYQLRVGTAPGDADLGLYQTNGTTSTTVSGLPLDGRTVYVRLWSLRGGNWSFNDYSYTAATGGPAAAMVTPGNGTVLAGASQEFTWSDAGASLYQLHVGTTVGGSDLGMFPTAGTTGTGTTVNGLPVNGSTLYVRLWSLNGATWTFNDYSYTAAGTFTKAVMVTPAGGSLLAGASQEFTWSDAGASLYQIHLGTSVGGSDLGMFPAAGTTGTGTTVNGLPVNGSTLYVRLWSLNGATWTFNDYSYTMLAPPGSITVPLTSLGSHLISWSASVTPGASYVLEEATSASFADAVTVYSGPQTSHIRGFSRNGSKYYRVKAQKGAAVSPWVAGGNASSFTSLGVVSEMVAIPGSPYLFALDTTSARLYRLDTTAGIIDRSLTLPNLQPVAIDYSAADQALYIVSASSGSVVRYDIATEALTTLPFSASEKGRDIAVANGLRRLYVLSDQGYDSNLFILDMDSGAVLYSGAIQGSSLVVNETEHWIFTGDSGLSPATLAKYSVSGDQLSLIQSISAGSNGRKVGISPDGRHVVFPCGSGNGNGYTIYDFDASNLGNVFGEWKVGTYPTNAAFSPDGSGLFGANGDHYDNYLYVMRSDYQQIRKLSFPYADDYAVIAPNSNGTAVVGFSYDRYNNKDYAFTFFNDLSVQAPADLGVVSEMVAGADPRYVYALDKDRQKLYRLDVTTQQIDKSIPLPYTQPVALDFSSADNALYIVSAFSGKVVKYDIAADTLSELTFSYAEDGRDIAVADDLRRLYILSKKDYDSNLFILDMESGTVLYSGAIKGSSLVVNEAEHWIFTGNSGLSPATLAKYSVSGDQLSLVQSVSTGGNGRKVGISPDGHHVVFPCGGGNGNGYTIYDFDASNLGNVFGEWNVGTYPKNAVFSPDGARLFGANGDFYDNYLYVMRSDDFQQVRKISFPYADDYAVIAPNSNGTAVVGFSYDTYNNSNRQFTFFSDVGLP